MPARDNPGGGARACPAHTGKSLTTSQSLRSGSQQICLHRATSAQLETSPSRGEQEAHGARAGTQNLEI
jgi:hypothetical protein